MLSPEPLPQACPPRECAMLLLSVPPANQTYPPSSSSPFSEEKPEAQRRKVDQGVWPEEGGSRKGQISVTCCYSLHFAAVTSDLRVLLPALLTFPGPRSVGTPFNCLEVCMGLGKDPRNALTELTRSCLCPVMGINLSTLTISIVT